MNKKTVLTILSIGIILGVAVGCVAAQGEQQKNRISTVWQETVPHWGTIQKIIISEDNLSCYLWADYYGRSMWCSRDEERPTPKQAINETRTDYKTIYVETKAIKTLREQFGIPLAPGCYENETGQDPDDLVMHITCPGDVQP